MTTIATRTFMREAAADRTIPNTPRRERPAVFYGIRSALWYLAVGGMAWGFIVLCVYTYATHGGNW